MQATGDESLPTLRPGGLRRGGDLLQVRPLLSLGMRAAPKAHGASRKAGWREISSSAWVYLPKLSTTAFAKPRPPPTLSQMTTARSTSLRRPSRTTWMFWWVVRTSAGWIGLPAAHDGTQGAATSRRVFVSSNQSSQTMIRVAVVRRLLITSGIPSAP